MSEKPPPEPGTKEFYDAQRARLRLAAEVEKAKKRQAGPQRSSTAQEICDLLDVSKMAITRWVKEGLPCDDTGDQRMFDAAEVMAWLRREGKSCTPGKPLTKQNEVLLPIRIRKENALVEKYERENKQAAGLLIDAAEEERRVASLIVALRNKFCGLGAALAATLAGLDAAEIQTLLDGRVEQILREFASGNVPLV